MRFGILCIVPLGNSVAIGCKEPIIHIWDANSYAREEIPISLGEYKTQNAMVSKMIKYRLNKASLSPRSTVKADLSGAWMLWAALDTAIVRIDVQKRSQIGLHISTHEKSISEITEQFDMIITASRDKVVIWNPDGATELKSVDIEMPLVYFMLPVGFNLWVAGYDKNDKEVIRVFDKDWKLLKQLNDDQVHEAAITSLVFINNSEVFSCWSASKDSTISVWI